MSGTLLGYFPFFMPCIPPTCRIQYWLKGLQEQMVTALVSTRWNMISSSAAVATTLGYKIRPVYLRFANDIHISELHVRREIAAQSPHHRRTLH